MIDRVFSLHRQGLSQRQIARQLGINRETVARYLRQVEYASKPNQPNHDGLESAKPDLQSVFKKPGSGIVVL
jgi:IS30 family transposase